MTRFTRHVLSAALFAVVAAFTVTLATEAEAATCPANMTSYNNAGDGESINCTCPAGATGGAVWGSGMYTTDSAVCAAAIHAGAVSATKGGDVTVYMTGGCPSYSGSQNNGVTTRNWGAYNRSFAFSWPAPGCAGQQAETPQACPRNLNSLRGQTGQTLSCTCSPQQYGGSIWGSGLYTTDSSVCGAALHSGAIPATGGTVRITITGGCSRYVGSQNNGITTSNWGSYNSSFYFGDDEPSCP